MDVRLDSEQVAAQLARLERLIAEGEIRLRALQSEVDRLRGQRDVWLLLQEQTNET